MVRDLESQTDCAVLDLGHCAKSTYFGVSECCDLNVIHLFCDLGFLICRSGDTMPQRVWEVCMWSCKSNAR